MTSHSPERGSALLLVFLAIAMFAALSFAVSTGFRLGGNEVSGSRNEKSQLDITDLLNSMQTFNVAVQDLVLKGCTPEMISYENPVVAGYTNPGSPADKHCFVFDPAGGGLTWLTPGPDINDGTPFYYTGDLNIAGLNRTATNQSELGVIVPHISYDTCMALNKAIGINNPNGGPPKDTGYTGGSPFQGVFTTWRVLGDDSYGAGNTEAVYGKKMACMQAILDPAGEGGTYFLYDVAVVR